MSHRKKRIPVGDGYEVIFDERAQGEESPYWAGRVLHHGKEVGTFRNEGRGGMTRIQPHAIVDAFRKLVDEADPVRGPTCFERESLVLVWAELVGYEKNYFVDNRSVPLAYIVREFAKDFGQSGTSSPSILRSDPPGTTAGGDRYKIEARTKNGPISWHPYTSRAEAEQALPGVKKRAPPGVIRGSWTILPIEPGSAEGPARAGAPKRRSTLSEEEHAALIETKRRIGRRWKAAVRHAWESGNYRDIATADEDLPSVLQRLRNASYFGPSGLIKYGTGHPASDDIRCAECGESLQLEGGEPAHENTWLDNYHDAEIPPSKG